MEDALYRWIERTTTLRADILALAALGLPILISVHVLLRKRLVGAAIGWIGLAWLAPVFGSTLYALFGINRVSRRARRLRRPLSVQVDATPQAPAPVPATFAALDRAVRTITGLPAVGGTAIVRYRNGDEAYPAMLAAIEEARESLAITSYIFRDDGVGGAFCEALARAQARGVEVRAIIDGIGSGYFFPAVWRRLRRQGVPAGLFMHSLLPWRMPFLNLRTHKKLLLVDGRVGFTGGVNIADANRLETHPRHPIRDTHFRIEGPVVEQMVQAFAGDWAFVTGEELEGPRWFPELAPVGTVTSRVVTSGPDADVEKIALVILQALAGARCSVRLMTPYFLPNELLVSALSLAAIRGVAVDVAIPRASDHPFVDWATRAHVAPLLESGVRIWLDDPPFDHSKALVVDGAWCFVGSANWDARSFRLNFELNVELYDAALAADLEALMAAKMETPLTLDALNARALPVRLRDAAVRLLLPYL